MYGEVLFGKWKKHEMLSPYNIDYDPSNGSWNVFYLEVSRMVREMAEDPFEIWEVQPWGFPTLGHAMNFVQRQIASPLKQEKPGGAWVADLRTNSDLKGIQVRIGQLVMVSK